MLPVRRTVRIEVGTTRTGRDCLSLPVTATFAATTRKGLTGVVFDFFLTISLPIVFQVLSWILNFIQIDDGLTR